MKIRGDHPTENRGENIGLLGRGSCKLNALVFQALRQIHIEDRCGRQHSGCTLFRSTELIADLILSNEGPFHGPVIHLINEE